MDKIKRPMPMQQLHLLEQQQHYNGAIHNMAHRFGGLLDDKKYYVKNTSQEGVNDMSQKLLQQGGFPQQNRMIRDKRHSLDMSTRYSYQAAKLRKVQPPELLMEGEEPRRLIPALINPNKLKQDYDDKILSVGFEFNLKTGDVFEWCNTHSYWLIYLQDLDELAYFRGDIRRCQYQINWLNEQGEIESTYAAIRGPVETRIEFIQKHEISVDKPNYSLNILMPKTLETVRYFKRYAKFYLKGILETDNNTCWRVEAVNTISMDNVLELQAVEYYSNEFEDDIENGIAGALTVEPIVEQPEGSDFIEGETLIKPKVPYVYHLKRAMSGEWTLEDIKKHPIKYKRFEDEPSKLVIMWNSNYSGQFTIQFKSNSGKLYEKEILVDSLF